VAAAAYRSGSELIDERTGQVHDYTRKGGVVSTVIVLPDGSSCERNALWNAAEAAENRKDARTAREWVVALPSELDDMQRQALAREFGRALAERYGVAVDVAVHQPDQQGDNRNHHAHVLTTTREVSRVGETVTLGNKATIELSDKARRARGLGPARDEVQAVRQLWQDTANRALEQAGRSERIDARSLTAQGIDREPTQHLGPVASDMERHGKASDRGDGNRQALANNAERRQLVAQVIDLQAERHKRTVAARPAEQLVAAWDSAKTRHVADVRQRADRLAVRIEAQADAIRRQRQQREADHAKEKPREPQGMLATFKRHAYEKAAATWTATAQAVTAWKQRREADLSKRLHRIAGYLSRREYGVPDKATARVERVMARKLPIEAARLPQARAEVAQRKQATAERERMVATFKKHAIQRSMKGHGYGDAGKTWAALPPTLRKMIEGYNAADAIGKTKALDKLRTDDGQKVLASLMPARDRDREGPSLGR
jgi:hypothetical protein